MECWFKDHFQKSKDSTIYYGTPCYLAEAGTYNTYQSTVSLLSAAVASGAK